MLLAVYEFPTTHNIRSDHVLYSDAAIEAWPLPKRRTIRSDSKG